MKKYFLLLISSIVLPLLFSALSYGQQESAPQKKYKLHLTSDPKEAKVFIDGVEKGSTPFTHELLEGKHKIRIEKEGYKPREVELEISSDLFKSYNLEKLPDSETSGAKVEKQEVKEEEKKAPEEKIPPKADVKLKEEATDTSGDVVELRQVQTRPKPVKMEKVKVPRKAKDFNLKGTLKVQVLITENGDVLKAEILEMIPNPPDWLHDAVIETLLKWKFSPAVKDGKNVKVWYPFLLTL